MGGRREFGDACGGAQAFKRACACFGLGRYLYDLDTVWVDLDQYNRPVRTPNLPEWALPNYPQRNPQPQAVSQKPTRQESVSRDQLLGKIRDLRQKVGEG